LLGCWFSWIAKKGIETRARLRWHCWGMHIMPMDLRIEVSPFSLVAHLFLL
jgi:hypothetical protein